MLVAYSLRRTLQSLLSVAWVVRFTSHAQLRKALLIAGNFSINGVSGNIAEYEWLTGEWVTSLNNQVFVYGEDNGGLIWDVAVNSTDSSKLFVGGLFDTDAEMSQTQLCSVAGYDGNSFAKVGEGLCSRGGDYGPIAVQTIVVGSDGDLFVGGNFVTRVWNGHRFVYAYHLARFDAASSSWLPLEGGSEISPIGTKSVSINALYWDAHSNVLFIGGSFALTNNRSNSLCLAMWTSVGGLSEFPGSSMLSQDADSNDSWMITALHFEVASNSLIIVGTFSLLNQQPCQGVALWNREFDEWRCLSDNAQFLSSISSVTMADSVIYMSGPVVVPGDQQSQNPSGVRGPQQYGIIAQNLNPYILEIANRRKENTSLNATVWNGSRYLLDDHSPSKQVRDPSRTPIAISKRSANQSREHRHRRRLRSNQFSPAFEWQGIDRPLRTNRTNTPTALPTVMPTSPWVSQWIWLPHFPFLSSTIYKIKAGTGDLRESLFFSLKDEGQPALMAWNFPPHGKGQQSNLTVFGSGRNSILGTITTIQQVVLPPVNPPTLSPTYGPEGRRDYTFVVIIACIGVGLIMGAGIICTCMSFSAKFPTNDKDNDDDMPGADVSIGAISLKTLSDGQTGNAVDFKECFERAMKTRHLPTYETLVIINPKEILLSRIVGEGSFGRVWSGQWRNNAVAVKEFVFAQAAIAGGSLERNKIIEEIVGEAGVMACLRHPKILQLYGCSLTMQAIWIVSELCMRGSLKMILMNPEIDLSIHRRLSICMDIADGMQYLHARTPPIIHRDLKSHNIFVQETSPGHFVAKIGDWGSARAVALTGSKSMTQGVGTACWLSPEVINNAHFSKSSDVYAFGMILWEVYTRQEIYEGLSAAQIIAKVAHEGLRPHVPRDCPWSAIMTQCWCQDSTDRPSFERIMKVLGHIYIKYSKVAHQRHKAQQQHQLSDREGSGKHGTGNSINNDVSGTVSGDEIASHNSADDLNTQVSGIGSGVRSYSGNHHRSGNYTNAGTFSAGGSRGGTGGGGIHLPPLPATTSATSSRSAYRTHSGDRAASLESQALLSEDLLLLQQEDHYLYPQGSGSSGVVMPASKRPRKFYDSFHPSLENIVQQRAETRTPFTSQQRLLEESPAHLAPEIAQLEAQGLLLGRSASYDVHGGSGGVAMMQEDFDEDVDDDADPIDFLFETHKSKGRRKFK